MFSADDDFWMGKAVALAQTAATVGEVPVGAVLVKDGKLIAEAYNQPIQEHDPSAHAEIVCLRKGAFVLQNYRLVNTTLYVTLEPCLMCAGALIYSRIERLVYGATDPRAGAIVSQLNALDYPFLNHRVTHVGGLQATICSDLLSNFFKQRRTGT